MVVNSLRNEVPLSVCKFTFFYHDYQMFSRKTGEIRPIFPRLSHRPLGFFPNGAEWAWERRENLENDPPIVYLCTRS